MTHEQIAQVGLWLKAHNTDNLDSNSIVDALEALYGFETELAKEF